MAQWTRTGYIDTPALRRALEKHRRVYLTGARYDATVVVVFPSYFEAWTESLPFVYGRQSSTLQGALDDLEARVRALDASSESPTDSSSP